MGFNSKGSGSFPGKTWYINSAIVEKALDIHSPEAISVPREGEVGVLLSVKNSNGNLQTLYVTGTPKGEVNPQNPWAGAFNVRNLLEVAGEWEVVDGIITQETLNRLVGKEVFYIRYLTTEKDDSGKPRYRTYREVGGSRERLERLFMKDANGKYISKFVGFEVPTA